MTGKSPWCKTAILTRRAVEMARGSQLGLARALFVLGWLPFSQSVCSHWTVTECQQLTLLAES